MNKLIVSQECKHSKTIEYTTGSMWFDGYEVMDDLEQHLICAECGKELNGESIRVEVEQDELECGYF